MEIRWTLSSLLAENPTIESISLDSPTLRFIQTNTPTNFNPPTTDALHPQSVLETLALPLQQLRQLKKLPVTFAIKQLSLRNLTVEAKAKAATFTLNSVGVESSIRITDQEKLLDLRILPTGDATESKTPTMSLKTRDGLLTIKALPHLMYRHNIATEFVQISQKLEGQVAYQNGANVIFKTSIDSTINYKDKLSLKIYPNFQLGNDWINFDAKVETDITPLQIKIRNLEMSAKANLNPVIETYLPNAGHKMTGRAHLSVQGSGHLSPLLKPRAINLDLALKSPQIQIEDPEKTVQVSNIDFGIHFKENHLQSKLMGNLDRIKTPDFEIGETQFTTTLNQHFSVLPSNIKDFHPNVETSLRIKHIRTQDLLIQKLNIAQRGLLWPQDTTAPWVLTHPLNHHIQVSAEKIENPKATIGPLFTETKIEGKKGGQKIDITLSHPLTHIRTKFLQEDPLNLTSEMRASILPEKISVTLQLHEQTLVVNSRLNLDIAHRNFKPHTIGSMKFESTMDNLSLAASHFVPPENGIIQSGSLAIHMQQKHPLKLQAIEAWVDKSPPNQTTEKILHGTSLLRELSRYFTLNLTSDNLDIDHPQGKIEALTFRTSFENATLKTALSLTDIEVKKVTTTTHKLNALSLHCDLRLSPSNIKPSITIQIGNIKDQAKKDDLGSLVLHSGFTWFVGQFLNIDRFQLELPEIEAMISSKGKILKPLKKIESLQHGRQMAVLPIADLEYFLSYRPRASLSYLSELEQFRGALELQGSLFTQDQDFFTEATLTFSHLHASRTDMDLKNLHGTLPVKLAFTLDAAQGAVPIFESEKMTLFIPNHTNKQTKSHISPNSLFTSNHLNSLSVDHLKLGKLEAKNGSLVALLTSNGLQVPQARVSLLGGDIWGHFSTIIQSPDLLEINLGVQLSGIDASYFKTLNLIPGPESALNGNMQMKLSLGSHSRNLEADFNVTHIGRKTLDRFLQTLDPENKDEKIQKTRNYLSYLRLNSLSAWIRHEQLNMDLDYDSLIGIPKTALSFKPVPNKLLRRYDISENILDQVLQPKVNAYIAPLFGWKNES